VHNLRCLLCASAAFAYVSTPVNAAEPWCSVCTNADHEVHFPAAGILYFAKRHAIPSVADITIVQVPAKPMEYDVTVDTHGKPCTVNFIGAGFDSLLIKRVQDAIREWEFNVDQHNGKTYCIRSKVLVYVRASPRGPTLFVPGLREPEEISK
jgi:hypothetical protein